MNLIHAATVSARDPERSARLYGGWMDYKLVDKGTVPADLAASWGAPKAAGRAYTVLQPASGDERYLRFIQADPVDAYKPLRSYGWNAIELCVRDVESTNSRVLKSPFEIIGPPRRIEGLDAIYPMQVQGPDQEIVYLTQINSDLPEFTLPRAKSAIDHLFIMVMGCSDMVKSQHWLRDTFGLKIGREKLEIAYTMMAKAYGTPLDKIYVISTMVDGKDVFLELDQYPDEAITRPQIPGALPPGIAITTFKVTDMDKVKGEWITPPAPYAGALYADTRAGTLRAPDGTLIEVVEG